ncbi:Alpha/Beta hydrolase protein [Aspergillus pseudocaelatus]|uniref:Alpha/Beta hydrolase protein n=1 Tax=Aspergillus pseudocaelatus TaxID=1825620 RepID=A0ABQ6W7G2_9EURO|nr:Alpha/Beta hydrolase protein [Aspergillus pseudocaelatus]
MSSSTALDKINVVNDPRVRRCSAAINGKTYGYLLAEPEGGFTRTIFLIHGFPDLSMGWRYQIPVFLNLGFRVVAVDCIGYGRSDAPTGSLDAYSYKSHADDLAELGKQLGCENIVLAGHDWGSVIASRFALYHPSFISHLILFVVPYLPPSPKYIDTADLAKIVPTVGYQLQFGSAEGVVESHTQDKEGIRAFLNGLYGGATPEGKFAMDSTRGFDFEVATKLGHTRLLSEEELKYYVEEYSRNGLQGPCNYYRIRQQSWTNEQSLLAQGKEAISIKCPVLYVHALADLVVNSEMPKAMVPFVPNLTVKEVEAGHWALWQKPAEVNAFVTEWLQQQGLVGSAKLDIGVTNMNSGFSWHEVNLSRQEITPHWLTPPRRRDEREQSDIHDAVVEESDDAHSIITPSKHTPKAFRVLRGSVSAGGPLRPFRLVKQDIANLRRRYVSDWTIFNQLIFASAVYVFFTNLLPGITFASDLYVLTGKTWGTIEVVFSTGLCGIIFSLYARRISMHCVPFLPFMAWSLIHAAWLHYILAIINAHDWTMRYVTTFATEIFSLLNSIIYFHKAIQELERAHDTLSFAAFLYAVIGAVGTMLLAIFLSTAESWKPLFHRYIRMGLTEYAAAISIIVFIAMPHIGELAHLDKMTLPVSSSFKPTSPDRDKFFVEFWTLPVGWVFAAIVPGIIITILFFFDHEVSSIICTIDRYGTRKPGGFAWDIILLGTTTAICGILGIPPANGLLPQAPLHSESLMHSEREQRTVVTDGEEKVETHEVKRVYEQRWSPFLHAGAILLFVSPPFMKVLGLTPTSVLAGLFMFMGEQSLSVNPILYRTFYLLTPPSELPSLPSSLAKKPGVLDLNDSSTPPRPSYIPIHLYTILQIVITVAIFIVTLTRGAPAFPVLIVALVPFRLLVMKRWWPREALRFVDAWACREGTPEDDEDAEAKKDELSGDDITGRAGLGTEALEIFSSQLDESRRRPSGTHPGTPAVISRSTSHPDEVDIADRSDSGQEWVELEYRTRQDEELGRSIKGCR